MNTKNSPLTLAEMISVSKVHAVSDVVSAEYLYILAVGLAKTDLPAARELMTDISRYCKLAIYMHDRHEAILTQSEFDRFAAVRRQARDFLKMRDPLQQGNNNTEDKNND